jgi:DNA (cytosine-5)-methyltransferase 1
MGLDEVLSDLEGLGYTARPFIIPACAVNAPHRRDRVWIIAHANGAGFKQGDKALPGRSPEQFDRLRFQSRCDDSYASGNRLQGRAEKSLSGFRHIQGELIRSGSVLGIVPDASQPVISGTCDGFPGRVDRIKALGNAVVPQIPELIGYAILEAEASRMEAAA